MDKTLDMSLDDIIKIKKSAERGRGRGSAPRGRGGRGGFFRGGRLIGGGRGSVRRPPLGLNIRSSSSAIAKTSRRPRSLPWQQNLLEESLAAAGLPGMESGTKLYISNLDIGVSNNDIRELFSEIGELKRYAIHFDNSGRPSGSAEVVYEKRNDAYAAHKRYNNVQLDGRPMKIEVVSPNAEVPLSGRINVVGGANSKPTRTVVMSQNAGRPMASATNRGFGQNAGRPMASATNRGFGQRMRGGMRNGQGRVQTQGRGGGRGQGQRRGGGGGGRGRGGGGRGKKEEKSAEQLDKELEKYHAEAMNVEV